MINKLPHQGTWYGWGISTTWCTQHTTNCIHEI